MQTGPAPIFVETHIRAPLSALWTRTQHPAEHTRWDLRFTTIDYLPRAGPDEPQRFRYETRLGFGLRIAGHGETVGQPGAGTSALRFGSSDPKSLIREGTGCWIYKPDGDGVLFRTIFQYEVRFGPVGRLIDRLIFRPLMGWATAWSFDRLRLWLEESIPPEATRRAALVHGISRFLLGGAWLYHGIVPKLLYPEHGELLITQRLFPEHANLMLTLAAILEIALGLAVWCVGRSRWVLGLSLTLLTALTAAMLLSQPESLLAPMNPLTLNLSLMGLAAAAWLTEAYTPSAARCERRQRG